MRFSSRSRQLNTSDSFSAAAQAGPATRGVFDGMAIGLSGLCLVHCLALPLLVTVLPNLSIANHWPEELHVIAALLAAAACAAAIVPRLSLFTSRQNLRILGCAAVGLAFLFGALAFSNHAIETAMTVIGSLFLIITHIQNLRC